MINIFQGRNIKTDEVDLFIVAETEIEIDLPFKKSIQEIKQWLLNIDVYYTIYSSLNEAKDSITTKKRVYVRAPILYYP